MTEETYAIAELAKQSQRQLEPASSVVTDALRKAIISGDLAGGSPLSQDELAKLFGVSRMPIREAIRQLQAEGFVEYFPRRGAVVAELSAQDVSEIDQTRLALETFAIRQSVLNLRQEDLAQAESILERMESGIEVQEWIELNTQFHLSFYCPPISKRMLSLIRLQYVSIARYANTHLRNLDYRARADQEHRALLAFVRAHDLEASVTSLAEHIVSGSKELIAFLSNVRLPATQ